MDNVSKIAIVSMTLLSYFIALISAFAVFPYVWLPMGIVLALMGAWWLYRYKYKNRGVLAIALFTNGTFIALGQYLEFIVPAISILVNILGAILTIIMMLLWYYWKEGQRHVQVRIKKEKIEEPSTDNTSPLAKIKILIKLLKKYRKLVKEKGYSHVLAFQFVYVEYQEEKNNKEVKNALDFVLGREVVLQRNEYDQSPDK